MKNKLAILQINKFFYPRGGSERYFFDLLKLLESHGHRVIPFSMRDDRNRSSLYKKYFIAPMNLGFFSLKNILKIFHNFEAARRLEKLILKEKPDLAHLHNINYQLSPSIIKILKKHRIPMVMTLHDYNIICPNAKLYNAKGQCQKCLNGKYYNCLLNKCSHNSYAKSFLGMLEAYYNQSWKKIYREINLFLAPSRYLRQMFIKFGWPENRIVNLKYFLAEPDYPSAIDPGNYILFFGRLAPEKGISVLLKAMKLVNPGIRLAIAGAGPEYKKIEREINGLKLASCVELIGPKYGDDLNKLIKEALAVIVPSIWPENMPYSVLETLALGKLVIASDTGGIAEMIKDNDNGRLFKNNDYLDLADKINSSILRNASVISMEDKGRDFISALNTEDHYKSILEIYNKLINK